MFRLRKQPAPTSYTQYVAAEPTFLRGAASAFDLSGSTAQVNVYPLSDGRKDDIRLRRLDRAMIRGDLLRARSKRLARDRQLAPGDNTAARPPMKHLGA
jgi:hypothetical protein